MTRRRDVLAGITAAATSVAQPDHDLDRLVADWLAARKVYRAARVAVDEAIARAAERYPAALPV